MKAAVGSLSIGRDRHGLESPCHGESHDVRNANRSRTSCGRMPSSSFSGMRRDGRRLGGEHLVARDGGAGLSVVHRHRVAGVDHGAFEDFPRRGSSRRTSRTRGG